MEFLRKTAAIFVSLLILFGCISSVSFANGTVEIKNGSYISLGSYMGEPIIWRCVGKDQNGALLISRNILCFKAFSSQYGLWSSSFLRTWLNSSDSQVGWGGIAPDSMTVDGNAYADESGFLAGFSAAERSVIKTVQQKSVVNIGLYTEANIGSESHVYYSSGLFSGAIQNYSSALGTITEDKVFCPNLLQMEILAANYPSELIASPTEKALAQSGSSKNAESRSNNYYWLRDGVGNEEFPDVLRCVYPDGKVFFSEADDGSVGVRPAIYIDTEIYVESGNGYENSPYVLTGSKGSSAQPAKGSANKNSLRQSISGISASITEGDYVVMGEINGREMLWRCVEINENGPLMVSNNILSFYAFDAAGKHELNSRSSKGSNNWEMSNIRYWLNSNEPEGDKSWPCGIAPLSDRTQGSNGYAMEKGFLSNFSPEETEMIKTVVNKTIIHPADADENTVGTEPLEQKRNIRSESNYVTAYSALSSEKIFLLSIEEAKRLKANFGEFFLAMPTSEAVASNEAYIDGLSPDRSAPWWLRDASAEEDMEAAVRTISKDGWVNMEYANNPAVGIRPAFYLNTDTAAYTEGNGSYNTPYRVISHSYGQWTVTKEPSCTEQGIRSRICQICQNADEEKIPALGHCFDTNSEGGNLLYTTVSRKCRHCGIVLKTRKLSPVPAVAVIVSAMAFLSLAIIKKRKK